MAYLQVNASEYRVHGGLAPDAFSKNTLKKNKKQPCCCSFVRISQKAGKQAEIGDAALRAFSGLCAEP
jgi:hypothetical protein